MFAVKTPGALAKAFPALPLARSGGT